MTIRDNKEFVDEIEAFLTKNLPIKLGVNKKNELIRLIYEISYGLNITLPEIIKQIDIEAIIEEGKGEFFHRFKSALLSVRYPSIRPGNDPHIMPIKMNPDHKECLQWDYGLDPRNIFIEEDIKGLEWTESFLKNFPEAEKNFIGNIAEGMNTLPKKPDSITLYNSRRENVFLAKNKAAFTKMCPCTKDCNRCGYWILNIGFGCPIDCTYCYLQVYSNAPGIVLTANIEDYYEHIRALDDKVTGKIRIGTGEFTDSLALDKYTKYSAYLIPFFRDMKNLVLELKTKIGDIDNVLNEEPHENVVISWSMNTRGMAKKYEKGGVSINERIDAARRAAAKGYKIGFHFDPIIYYDKWEDEYKGIVKELFSVDEIRRNTVWISLGTLRYTPGLKQAAEERFVDNHMFYQGEFFTDIDGKLRYPRELRIEMYNKMIKWIKSFSKECWVYLCMEPDKVWKKTELKQIRY